MSKFTAAIAGGLLLFLADASPAKEWRGIIPLHSTRADVIRLLGKPDHDDNSYDVSEGQVFILYAQRPCERHFGLRPRNVSAGTVLQITLMLKQPGPIEEFGLDLKKFVKEPADYG